MSSVKFIKEKLFEDVVSFDNYISSKLTKEQIDYELKECEKALIGLRNRLLYAKGDIGRVQLAFENYSREVATIASRVASLRNTYNSVSEA